MTPRARLRQLHDLQRLQGVERDQAQRRYADACQTAEAARAEAEAAGERAASAADHWFESRSAGTFDPHTDLMSAERLIAAQRMFANSAEAVVAAEDECARREHAWQRAEARRRACEQLVRDLRHDIVRRDEEARHGVAILRADRDRP